MNRITSAISTLNWAFVGFALSLLIPSTAVFQKYLGYPGVIAYIFVASMALLLFVKFRSIPIKLTSKFTDKQVLWLIALTMIAVLIVFAVIYPIANSGVIGGGSDGDDALNVATSELLHGRYPYYPKTYLGNPISPLPGALLLATPFVLLGNAAYQNLFWLLIFILAMKSYLKDGRLALLLLWTILALSPTILHQFVVGNGYISNSLYVLLFLMWLFKAINQPHLRSWQKALPAIFLGIGLSSRANFLLLLPLIFAALVNTAGWKSALKYIAITIITFGVITIPFYLYDPQGFSPLHTANKLAKFQPILPFAGILIPFVTGIIAVILAFLQLSRCNLYILLRNSAIVLAFPILCGIILSTIVSGQINFSYAYFGTFFLFFGAVASWSILFETRLGPNT